MVITIRCTNTENIGCPICGSKSVVGIGSESCHCGQCGQSMVVELVEKIKENEQTEEFKQMSLF